jgi:hypothetical protein
VPLSLSGFLLFLFFFFQADRWDRLVRSSFFPAFTSSTGNRRPALLPRHHRALIGHQYPTYKYPALTFLSPFHLSPIDAANREKSLAGAPLLHGRRGRLCRLPKDPCLFSLSPSLSSVFHIQ